MLHWLLDLYSLVLLASVILSWVDLSPDNPFVRLVRQLTEPVLAPLRRVIPPVGMFDLSFMVAFFGLLILRTFIYSLA